MADYTRTKVQCRDVSNPYNNGVEQLPQVLAAGDKRVGCRLAGIGSRVARLPAAFRIQAGVDFSRHFIFGYNSRRQDQPPGNHHETVSIVFNLHWSGARLFRDHRLYQQQFHWNAGRYHHHDDASTSGSSGRTADYGVICE